MVAAIDTPLVFQDHAQRHVFRVLVDAAARPGQWKRVDADRLDAPAHVGVLACLGDAQVTLANPHGVLSDKLIRFLGATMVDPNDADIIVADAALAPDGALRPKLGALTAPEDGATLILVAPDTDHGPLVEVSGPGVEARMATRLTGLHPDWLRRRAEWVGMFPLGVDLLVCGATALLALPRSTHVAICDPNAERA